MRPVLFCVGLALLALAAFLFLHFTAPQPPASPAEEPAALRPGFQNYSGPLYYLAEERRDGSIWLFLVAPYGRTYLRETTMAALTTWASAKDDDYNVIFIPRSGTGSSFAFTPWSWAR